MKLYYTPAVCSLCPHIVLGELGLPYDIEKVDLRTKKTETGADFNKISEKSSVPLLVLDNGQHLTEGVAIIQYLADLKPELNLAPKNGTFERVKLQEMLNYLATEFHKSHYPLFFKECGQEAINVYTKKIYKCYDFLSEILKNNQYVMGNHFTIADAYAFTVINWHNFVNIDLSPWQTLCDYQNRIASRPSVQNVLRAEGVEYKKAA
jgi:glutathione S-transferase